jgi:hypothetical protein
MTSPLCQVPAICPEKVVDLDLPCALALVLALAQAAGATKIIMSNNMIASKHSAQMRVFVLQGQ